MKEHRFITEILSELSGYEDFIAKLKNKTNKLWITCSSEPSSYPSYGYEANTQIHNYILSFYKQRISALKQELVDALGIEKFDPRLLEK